MTRSVSTAARPPTAMDWLGLLLITLTAALAAVLTCLLVPLYAGSSAVLIPVAVVLAVASNVVLPRLARALIPRTPAALAPFFAWLLVMVFFGVMGRPEGDVILPGGPGAVEWVTYGVLLGGALAGVATIVLSSPPPAPRARPAAAPEGPPTPGRDRVRRR